MAKKRTARKAARGPGKKHASGASKPRLPAEARRRPEAPPGRSPGAVEGPAESRGRPGRKSRILVVDDHPIVRQGVVKLVEQEADLEVSGEAGNTTQALKALARAKADLAIVDLTLEKGNGLELVKKIKARFPRLPVLVLSMHEESVFAERVLRAGGSGYVMKQEPSARLLAAIRRVLGGGIYLSEKVQDRIVRSVIRGGPSVVGNALAFLSDREIEVFQLLGLGLGTRQVAEALYLSVGTVETYRQRIKEKLGLGSAAELVHRAVEWTQSGGPGHAGR